MRSRVVWIALVPSIALTGCFTGSLSGAAFRTPAAVALAPADRSAMRQPARHLRGALSGSPVVVLRETDDWSDVHWFWAAPQRIEVSPGRHVFYYNALSRWRNCTFELVMEPGHEYTPMMVDPRGNSKCEEPHVPGCTLELKDIGPHGESKNMEVMCGPAVRGRTGN